jgi:fused signal recognition particle receptor
MAFFRKLRDRLTRSSTRLDEGIAGLVAADPEPAAPAPEPVTDAKPRASDAPSPDPEPMAEPGAVAPEPESMPEPVPVAPEPRPLPEPESPTPAPPPDPPRERAVRMGRLFRGGVALPESRPVPEPEPPPPAPVAPPAAEPAARPGLFGRLRGDVGEPRRRLDDAMLAELEDLLVAADLGVETALAVAANMAEGRMGRALTATEIKRLLADEIARVLDPVARPLPVYPKKPQVVLVVGVNGSGKTTTIGKLAAQFRAAGKTVRIAACDTFRAAAVEQLQIWGQRAGVPVMTAPPGADPAALAFDALAAAEAERADLLLIDTAGRLQNRADLMAELEKIVRVIRKRDPGAPHNTLLVLDATTGQNALQQVEVFRRMADVTGLVMTKLDGTAKGGVLVALADRFGLPIHAIGVGEQIDDLDAFDPRDFANALTGADT